MKLNDILNEIDFDRGIIVKMEGGKILAGDKKHEPSQLKRLDIAYEEGNPNEVYRGYLFTDKGQINLNPKKKGLGEFLAQLPTDKPYDFLKQKGVIITFSDFDVS